MIVSRATTRILPEEYIGEELPDEKVEPRLRHLNRIAVTAAYRLAGKRWDRVGLDGQNNVVVR